MIFGDRIIVMAGGGLDPKGNPLPVTENGPFPGSVQPLRSSVRLQHGGTLDTAYLRLHIDVTGGDLLADQDTPTIKWRGTEYYVQGAVEPWTIGGRLDHYEATISHNSG